MEMNDNEMEQEFLQWQDYELFGVDRPEPSVPRSVALTDALTDVTSVMEPVMRMNGKVQILSICVCLFAYFFSLYF